jgi:hypothetical protein
MAVHGELLESIAKNGGVGFLTFVLNPDAKAMNLDKKPVMLTDISLRVQSVSIAAEP